MSESIAILPCGRMVHTMRVYAEALAPDASGNFLVGVPGVVMILKKGPDKDHQLEVERAPTGAEDGVVQFAAKINPSEMRLYSVTADASGAPLFRFFDKSQDIVRSTLFKTTGKAYVHKATFQFQRGLRVTPEEIPFETIPLGGTAPKPMSVTLNNPHAVPIQIKSAVVTGPAAAVFTLSKALANVVIPKNAAITFNVIAAPNSAAALLQARLDITLQSGIVSQIALEASAYSVSAFAARTLLITPGVDNADFHYTIGDPKGVVKAAKIEILHPKRPGKIIHTIAGPFVAGDNAVVWRGEVANDKMDHDDLFVRHRIGPYTAKVTITRAGGLGPLSQDSAPIKIKDDGELLIELYRANGAPLHGRATFKLTHQVSHVQQTVVSVAKTDPHREEVLVRGLAVGTYDIELDDRVNYLAGESATARLAPSRLGKTVGKIQIGLREKVTFEITEYTNVQFVAYRASPTGTITTGPGVISTYNGETDDQHDLFARCAMMKRAMQLAEAAHPSLRAAPDTLKVFMAPEFYFRGQGGGYPFEMLEAILPNLREEAKKTIYEDWLFVYGTAIGYFKHGENDSATGLPSTYKLLIESETHNSARQLIVVKKNDALNAKEASTAAVCKRIVIKPAPANWNFVAGGKRASIKAVRCIDDLHYELTLMGALLPVGPGELIEPKATEIINVAYAQRGGANPGGKREQLSYKEYVSSIDFLGLHHPDTGKDFYNGPKTHKADIHGTPERRIFATEGSIDPNGAAAENRVATGGTTEQTKTGLGGGALFTSAGVNFAVEVCLDHLEARLANFVLRAPSPGDVKPQVLLIPSWGMEIATGPVYTLPTGLAFNVDGRITNTGELYPSEAVVNSGLVRCPDHPHSAVTTPQPVLAKGDCGQQHYACNKHMHWTNVANCERCNAPTTPVRRCPNHTQYGSTCQLCGVAGLAIAGYWCNIHNSVPSSPCPTCGPAKVLEPYYRCTSNRNILPSAPNCVCGVATLPANGRCCPHHRQTAYAARDCPLCATPTPMTLEPRKLVDYTAQIVPTVLGTAVSDPGVDTIADETTLTVIENSDSSNGDKSRHTSILPLGRGPLPIPDWAPTTAPPAATVGDTKTTQRTWTTNSAAGTLTVTSVETVKTEVAGTKTKITTAVKTTYAGTMQAANARLFATPGAIDVYPPRPIPQAETFP